MELVSEAPRVVPVLPALTGAYLDLGRNPRTVIKQGLFWPRVVEGKEMSQRPGHDPEMPELILLILLPASSMT